MAVLVGVGPSRSRETHGRRPAIRPRARTPHGEGQAVASGREGHAARLGTAGRVLGVVRGQPTRMRANRSRDTRPELLVRRALHGMGLRYRVATRPAPDIRVRADMVFAGARVAVFIDGCFWHGCAAHISTPRTNTDYWVAKIARNRARDSEAGRLLANAGWTVVRVWEHDDPVWSAARIRAAVDAGVNPVLQRVTDRQGRILRACPLSTIGTGSTRRARSTRSAGMSPTRSSRVSWSWLPSSTAPEASSTSVAAPESRRWDPRPRSRARRGRRYLGAGVGGRADPTSGASLADVLSRMDRRRHHGDLRRRAVRHLADRAVFHFLLDSGGETPLRRPGEANREPGRFSHFVRHVRRATAHATWRGEP